MSSLMHETETIQEVIRSWLTHSVQCDDINRILEPFLILLLESDTSRTSVQNRGEYSFNPQGTLKGRLKIKKLPRHLFVLHKEI